MVHRINIDLILKFDINSYIDFDIQVFTVSIIHRIDAESMSIRQTIFHCTARNNNEIDIDSTSIRHQNHKYSKQQADIICH